jgi:hypothetical protein
MMSSYDYAAMHNALQLVVQMTTQHNMTPPAELTWLLAAQCCLHLCCGALLGPRVAAQLIQQKTQGAGRGVRAWGEERGGM